MALDLDPETTTIATLQTLVADQIKAERRALGLRVLRNTLSPSEIILKINERELRQEEKLNECGIMDGSLMEATVRLTDEEVSVKQVRARKGEEMKQQKERRTKVIDEHGCKLREQLSEMLQIMTEIKNGKRTNNPEESSAEEPSALGEERAPTEGEFQETEEWYDQEDQEGVEEAPQPEQSQPSAESPMAVAEEVDRVDPFDDYDGNKENWDPQILRNAGTDVSGLTAAQ